MQRRVTYKHTGEVNKSMLKKKKYDEENKRTSPDLNGCRSLEKSGSRANYAAYCC